MTHGARSSSWGARSQLHRAVIAALASAVAAAAAGCGGDGAVGAGSTGSVESRATTAVPSPEPSTTGPRVRRAVSAQPPSSSSPSSPTTEPDGDAAGDAASSDGAARPTAGPEAGAVDTSDPDRVVGTGTPGSCTSEAVVAAVAAGGIVTFDCGPDPVTIPMAETAKVVNAANPVVVLDGGGRVTLSGQGARRILYMNTCDEAQGWTTSHCDDQDHPRLTVQNITFADGDSTGQGPDDNGAGGGAIFVRGGRLTVVNATFTGNRCEDTGPDVGGAAIRVFDQHEDRPVRVVGSAFTGGECSNGGALSSIGVSWDIADSVFTGNRAVGVGANPARGGTPGGGSGGAIYTDGNLFTVTLTRTTIEGNRAAEGGGAVFFVSNDRSGTMRIEDSTLRGNPSDGFETDGFPGIFFLGASPPAVVGSSLG